MSGYSYLGIFLTLLLSGYIIPVPEEILLIALGYLASAGDIDMLKAMPFATFGIFCGDLAVHLLSRSRHRFVDTFTRRLEHSRLAQSRFICADKIYRTVFISRFLPGLRFVGPMLSGIARIPILAFCFYNILALLIFVPALVLVGYYFHNQILPIITTVEEVKHGIFILATAVVAYYIMRYVKREFVVLDEAGENSKKLDKIREIAR